MSAGDLRRLRVGDVLPPSAARGAEARRLRATAIVLPGTSDDGDRYRLSLEARSDEFAAWDGRVLVRDPDGMPAHRVLIVDRYGQVYAAHDAAAAVDLPGADALAAWFRFLATACPECGVLDDPVLAGPTL